MGVHSLPPFGAACLHPSHWSLPTGLQALRQQAVDEILRSSPEFPEAGPDALKVIGVTSKGLTLACGETIPLLLAEVVLHKEGLGCAVLSISAPLSCDSPSRRLEKESADPTGWLLLVDGSAETLLGELEVAGAISARLCDGFALRKRLGKGGFASTYRLSRPREGGGKDQLAVKVLHKHEEKSLDALRGEVEVLAAVQGHPSVVAFHGVTRLQMRDGNLSLGIVMDLCRLGDLLDRACEVTLLEFQAREMFKGVFAGLAHIHSRGIVHRDVKCENIFLRGMSWAVLGDFGAACWVGDEKRMAQRVGTVGFVAPEVWKGKSYCEKVDIFGGGSALFFSLTGKNAFGNTEKEKWQNSIMGHAAYSQVAHLPASLQSFLRGLLEKESLWRFSAEQALEHTWMVELTPSSTPKSSRSRLRRSQSSPCSLLSMASKSFDSCSPLKEQLPPPGLSLPPRWAPKDVKCSLVTAPSVEVTQALRAGQSLTQCASPSSGSTARVEMNRRTSFWIEQVGSVLVAKGITSANAQWLGGC